MRLALFDLDHTLLPIDSDYEWSRFLVKLGVVDEAWYERRNLHFYEQYKAGCLDIMEFLDFQLAPLARESRATLAAWHQQFMAEVIEPNLRESALQLVQQHRDAGDLCAIVTATNAFITAPIAARFGISHLIATDLEESSDPADLGRYTGKPRGLPNFQAGKVQRTEDWLHSLQHDWQDFEASYFYSDSRNDLPLLLKVTHPIATNPDPTLAAHAQQHGWTLLKLFE